MFMRHFIFLFVGVLFICMIEEVPLRNDPNWSIFKIIFEVVSGYGTLPPPPPATLIVAFPATLTPWDSRGWPPRLQVRWG